MATSVVEIWNHALARVGNGRQVSDELERTTEAKLLRTQYPLTRDRLLEGFDWAFARRYGSLSAINDAAELQDGWPYAYEWPVDAIAFRGILNPSAVADDSDFPFETCMLASGTGRKIMATLEDATGLWTVRVTEVHRFPDTFIHALSFALQGEIAMALAKDMKQTQAALSLFGQAEQIARVSTAMQARSRWQGADRTPGSIKARA